MTAILFLILLFSVNASAQIRSHVVLPRSTDTGSPPLYTALGCLDNHNCLACGLTLRSEKYYPFVERSIDGGVTWQHYTLPIEPLADIRAAFFDVVHFIDSLNIILTGDKGLIFRSMDGGKTWIDRSHASGAAAGEVAFSDSAHGVIAMGGGTLLRTSDAGVTWDSVPGLPYRLLNSPKIVGPDTILVYGQHNRLFSVNPSGIDSIDLPFDLNRTDTGGYRSIGAIVWFQGQEGVAAGVHYLKDDQNRDTFHKLLARTTDNGKHWNQVLDEDFGKQLWGGTLDQSGTGLMYGDGNGHLVWTRDWRGGSWAADSIIADVVFHEMSQAVFLDSETVLALFDDGTILVGPGGGFVGKFKLPTTRGVDYFESIVRNTYVYPNPTSTVLNLTTPVRSGVVRFVDVLGRVVLVMNVSEGAAKCSVATLVPGVYSLMLEANHQTIPLGKVVVQR